MPPIITTMSDLCVEKTTATTFKRLLSHAGYSNGFVRQVGVGEGMTGQIQPPLARQRELKRMVRPVANLIPTADELKVWLPWCLSGTQTGGGTLGSPFLYQCTDASVEVRDVHYRNYPTAAVETAFNCGVAQASFSCDAQNPFLALNVNLVGKTMTQAGTFPSSPTAIETVTSPFVLPDTAGAVLLAGTSLRVAGIACLFNFTIDEERFLNTLDLTDLVKTDAVHTVSLTFPYGERVGAYVFNGAADPLVITWTNGTRIFTLTYPLINFPEDAINRGLRTEVGVTITGRAFRSLFNVDDCITASLVVP